MDITGSIFASGIKDQVFNDDQVGRLTQAGGNGIENQWQRRYTYDRCCNRTTVESRDTGDWCTKQVVDFKRTAGVPQTNRATAAQDYSQCSPGQGSELLYSASGEVTAYRGQKLLYDGESRLAQVIDNLGVSVGEYSYDAANRRVRKVVTGATTNYVWEGSRVIAEYNGVTGALLTEYVYAGDRMLAREQSGAVTYYHQDRLSVRMLTDGSGNWAGTQSHEPFGEQVQERDLVSKWRFTTYERDDETGSDYAVNRQYLTNAGRFMRPDPVGGNLGSPQSFNRYVYTTNDPINLVDPDGKLSDRLSNSMKSSDAPARPRVRNSLMTMLLETARAGWREIRRQAALKTKTVRNALTTLVPICLCVRCRMKVSDVAPQYTTFLFPSLQSFAVFRAYRKATAFLVREPGSSVCKHIFWSSVVGPANRLIIAPMARCFDTFKRACNNLARC